jgi:hypothetical protein
VGSPRPRSSSPSSGHAAATLPKRTHPPASRLACQRLGRAALAPTLVPLPPPSQKRLSPSPPLPPPLPSLTQWWQRPPLMALKPPAVISPSPRRLSLSLPIKVGRALLSPSPARAPSLPPRALSPVRVCVVDCHSPSPKIELRRPRPRPNRLCPSPRPQPCSLARPIPPAELLPADKHELKVEDDHFAF